MNYFKTILLMFAIVLMVLISQFISTDRNQQQASSEPLESRNDFSESHITEIRATPAEVTDTEMPVVAAIEPDQFFLAPSPALQPLKHSEITMPKEVSTRNLEEVYAYLLQTEPSDHSTLKNIRSSKNNIMDTLITITPSPVGLVDTLIDVATNERQDIVVRDYAFQHLVSPFNRARAEERRRILDTLIHAASHEKGSSLPGTALLALNRLSRNGHLDSSIVGQLALAVASDESCGALGRITAVQLCADLGVQDIAPVAEKMARHGGGEVMRRTARTALIKLSRSNAELATRVIDVIQDENCHGCL